jgi:hypoxanthine phosphoribosyltransferase
MAAVCNSKEFKSVRMHVYEVAHHSGPGRSAEAVVRSAPNVFKGVTFAMRTMRILVVDDVIDSGKTINAVRDSVMLFRQDLTRPPVVQITYACLFLSARHSARADIIAHEMKPDDCWVKMPYEGIDG